MSLGRLILVSLAHHRRANLAVVLGASAGVAVLCGALVVGDSMRASLRALALERLGRVDAVLRTDRFFRAELADELAASAGFAEHYEAAVPVVLLEASLERPDPAAPRRVNRVSLLGVDDRFWTLGSYRRQDDRSGSPPAIASAKAPAARGAPGVPVAQARSSAPNQTAAATTAPRLLPRSILLNRPTAEALGAAPGDAVVLRVPRAGAIPAETALGRKDDTVASFRLVVEAVIEAEGLGRFALESSQQFTRNAYVSRQWLAEMLERPNQANAILVAGRAAGESPSPGPDDLQAAPLQAMLSPRAEDYGLRIEASPLGYLNITSDRLLIDPRAEREILARLGALGLRRVQPALTYLANRISCGTRSIPYSTVTAIEWSDSPLGPLKGVEGERLAALKPGEIALNAWAAAELQPEPGDTIRLEFFEPDAPSEQPRERAAELRLAAIAALDGAAADPLLTPEVPGVTDSRSIADWNPPFPFDARRIRPQDEQYWDDHRATPKALVALQTGRRLWSSRFGQSTSIRVAPEGGLTAAQLADRLRLDPAVMGFVVQPVKAQALAASAGTTSFAALFLAFSAMVIASSVMLVALLFSLGIERRAAEIGLLLAVGWSRRRVTAWLLAEGLILAALGGLLGAALGVGYAAVMLHGLRTWWVAAVVTPFMRLDVCPASLALGCAAGVAVVAIAIVLSVRRVARAPARRLLRGETTAAGIVTSSSWLARFRERLLMALLVGVVALAVAAGLAPDWFGQEGQAGMFFGAGAAVLAVLLAIVLGRLRRGATGPAVAPAAGNLVRLAARNLSRFPGQSALVVALVAAACFLVIAVGAFRSQPIGRIPRLDGGDGGFALWAESTQPIHYDLATAEGRRESGFSNDEERLFDGARVISLRARPGDDASCLNLYRPRRPRLLGVPEAMIRRGGFAWAAWRDAPEARENPWNLLLLDLGRDADGAPRVPVVLEKNTANYALHLWKGVGQTFDIDDGRGGVLRLVIVGLLDGSVFQGDLLVAESQLVRYFPDAGRRVFLVECPPARAAALASAFERALGDFGLAVEATDQRLARFLAVQNTYLSTFQSLGALGFILGTLGLAAVELRSIVRRRGELALLRAVGFRRAALAALVLLETTVLLIAGLAVGLLGAWVAVLPHLFGRGARLPWAATGAMLLAVVVVGLLSGFAAARAALRAPLATALREEK